ncbi:unnamed protein product [Parajaminaea phylloscopi]
MPSAAEHALDAPSAIPTQTARPSSPATLALAHQLTAASKAENSGQHSSKLSSKGSASGSQPLTVTPGLRLQSSSSSLRPAPLTNLSPSPVAAKTTTTSQIPAVVTSRSSTDDRIWKTPAARKAERDWKRQTEKTVASDPRFKKYTASIDRALLSFDSVNEWADFVGALSRLEKILGSPPPLATTVIPRSLLLSKRLSQCLNPALPTGVHHRTLAVYRQILTLLSSDGLRRDLSVWSPGLLSFFERSNTSTRPVILGLLEDFYLPLGEDLRPITRSFVRGILPGLEEEGAEHFDRTMRLLDGLERCIGADLYWRCFWTTICSSPATGQAGVNFLSKRTPPCPEALKQPLSADEVQSSVDVGRLPCHVRLMPRALSVLLNSGDVLTLRGGLDLLLQMLPLDTVLYQCLPLEDRLQLMRSAIGVVQRRELSLNRRLWSWLGGTGRVRRPGKVPAFPAKSDLDTEADSTDSEEQEAAYFRSFGVSDLREAILSDARRLPTVEQSRDFDIVASQTSSAPNDPVRGTSTSSASHRAEGVSARQRPYRIFLALLDKWSIGGPITEVIALDLFRALPRHIGQDLPSRAFGTEEQKRQACTTLTSPADEVKELMTTAAMVFDALDKEIIVRKVLKEVDEELRLQQNVTEPKPTAMLSFLLQHFSFRDDIARDGHLGNMLAALLHRVNCCLSGPSVCQDQLSSVVVALHCCHQLVESFGSSLTPSPGANHPAFGEGWNLTEEIGKLYAPRSQPSSSPDGVPGPIDYRHARVHEAMLSHAMTNTLYAEGRSRSHQRVHEPSQDTLIFLSSLRLCTRLAECMHPGDKSLRPSPVSRESIRAWASQLIAHIATSNVKTAFSEFEAIMGALKAVTALQGPDKCVDLAEACHGTNLSVADIFSSVLDCLQPDMVPFSIGATRLFWLVASLTVEPQCLQRHLCSMLLSREAYVRERALNGFGTVWRHSGDELLRPEVIAAPVARILDMLRSTDIARKQDAETWLRRNVRSYTPIFALIVQSLQSAEGCMGKDQRLCTFESTCFENISIESLEYPASFDHPSVNYWLGALLGLARYGAGGFIRAAVTLTVPEIEQGEQRAFDPHRPFATYMGLFVKLLMRYLRTEVRSFSTELTRSPSQSMTHSLSLEMLNFVISKNGLSPAQLAEAETCLLERLLVSLSLNASERQHRLLLALHAAIASRLTQVSQVTASRAIPSSQGRGVDAKPTFLPPAPLLVVAIRAGLNVSDNLAVLTHWVDFTLTVLPGYSNALTSLLLPLNAHLCLELNKATEAVRRTFGQRTANPSSGAPQVGEGDLVVLINAVERTVVLCVDGLDTSGRSDANTDGRSVATSRVITLPPPAAGQEKSDASGPKGVGELPDTLVPGRESAAEGGTTIFGYVTGMFTSEVPSAALDTSTSPPNAKYQSLAALRLGVATLHRVWTLASVDVMGAQRKASFAILLSRSQSRSRRALERMYKKQAGATVEALIDCWRNGSSDAQEAVFEILGFLAPGSSTVVAFLCDTLAQRLPSPGLSHAPARAADQITPAWLLLNFLEAFLTRIDTHKDAASVWHSVVQTVKDIIANTAAHKTYLFAALRCTTVLGQRLTSIPNSASSNVQHQSHDERRVRKDLQETYIKLFDLCIVAAGKAVSAPPAKAGEQSAGDSPLDPEKVDHTPTTHHGGVHRELSAPGLNVYLTTTALPASRTLVADSDKIANCCSNAIYYVIAPQLRIKSTHRSFDHIVPAVPLMAAEITRISPSAVRTLRTPLLDAFSDPRFFQMSTTSGRRWCQPLLAVHATDREKYFLAELVGRISTSGSANIFTNREAELVSRSLSLRRLSLVLFSSTQDQFLPQLPAIQEKLVDVLRYHPPERVNAEVLLCFRVMLIRFQARHLNTLWPIIITELVRIFDVTSENDLPADASDGVGLLLQACKFVDLLLCLQTAEFQGHQWLFVNDVGIDVDLASDGQEANSFEDDEALFDRLADLISHRGHHPRRPATSAAAAVQVKTSCRVDGLHNTAGRSPLLCGVKHIATLEDLCPFLKTASRTSFSRAATSQYDPVDVAAVEEDLLRDLFDGQEA